VQVILASALGKEPERRGLWVLFTLFSIATIVTVPTGVYPVAAAACIYLLTAFAHRRDAARVLRYLSISLGAIVAVSALVYWPVMLASGSEALLSNRFVQPETSSEFVARLPGALIESWRQWNSGWQPWFTWILAACAAIPIAGSVRRAGAQSVFPVAVIVSILICFAQRVTPPGRVWLFLLPIFLATAAAGLIVAAKYVFRLNGAAGFTAALVLLVIGSVQSVTSGVILTFPETGTNNDAPQIAHFIANQLRRGDLVISTLPASYPVRYYLVRRGISEAVWSAGERGIDRVIAVVDKPELTMSPSRLNDALNQAFEQSFTGVDRENFMIGTAIYESANTEVLTLTRRTTPEGRSDAKYN
jgi:hypothetical protein